MSKKEQGIDETHFALKYPDYKSWRDLDAAMARGGFWPDGSIVRISDPEMKPQMDKIKNKILTDPDYARELLSKLNLLPKHTA